MLNWTNNFPYNGAFWSCIPCLYCESSKVDQHEILWIIMKYCVNHHKILWSISWIHLTLILLLSPSPKHFLISFENSYPKKKKKGLGKIGFKIFFPSLNNMGNLAFRWSRIRPLASSQSCCSALLCVCWVFLTEPLPSWEQRWQAVPEKGVNISSSNYWKSWEYSIYCVIK